MRTAAIRTPLGAISALKANKESVPHCMTP